MRTPMLKFNILEILLKKKKINILETVFEMALIYLWCTSIYVMLKRITHGGNFKGAIFVG
jgi:hypothetical protein